MSASIERELIAAFELQQSGKFEQAESGFRNVLAREPDNIHALNLLGINYLEQTRYEEATDLLDRAARMTPNDPETLNSLGLALAKGGDPSRAITQFQRALKTGGPNLDLLGNLGAALVESGRAAEALAPLAQAVRHSPRDAGTLANLAKALSALGRYEEARPAAEQAAEIQSRSPEIQNILGEILLKQGRHRDARACFERSLTLVPGQINAAVTLATTFKEEGEIAQANRLLLRLSDEQPSNPEPLFNLGVLAEQLGDGEEALSYFRKAIALDPRFAKAYYQAAQLKGITPPVDLKVEIEQQLATKDLGNEEQILFRFALATLLEKENEYSASLAEFKRAHSAVRDTYDPQATERMHESLRAAFENRNFPSVEFNKDEKPRPLFVLGMPRSGTSLAEQILASHPQIEAGGESSFLTDATNKAAKLARKSFPQCVTDLSPEQLVSLGQSYRARLFDGKQGQRWVIDKTPLNFQLIGFAKAILPEARFINCERDPLNTCLSIYKIPFDQNQNYAARFASLGHFYERYRGLMEFWKDVLGDELQSLRYECLVEDIEREVSRILDWLGLNFDPAVLEFHTQQRLVRTPSATQVNQPIYSSSVALAEKYGADLDELRNALSACYG